MPERVQSCSRCRVTTEVVIEYGKDQAALGWSDLVLSGRPFLGMLLCPTCVTELRVFLTTPQRDTDMLAKTHGEVHED